MFRHLICRWKRLDQLHVVERRSPYGLPYQALACRRCGRAA